MRCSYCGQEQDDNNLVCIKCNRQLGAFEVYWSKLNDNEKYMYISEFYRTYKGKGNVLKNRGKTSLKGILILFAIFILITIHISSSYDGAGAIFGIFLLFFIFFCPIATIYFYYVIGKKVLSKGISNVKKVQFYKFLKDHCIEFDTHEKYIDVLLEYYYEDMNPNVFNTFISDNYKDYMDYKNVSSVRKNTFIFLFLIWFFQTAFLPEEMSTALLFPTFLIFLVLIYYLNNKKNNIYEILYQKFKSILSAEKEFLADSQVKIVLNHYLKKY